MNWTPDRIRALRAHARLTQRDLAELLRVHRNAVYHWEHGKRAPNAYSSRALDVVARRQKFTEETDDRQRAYLPSDEDASCAPANEARYPLRGDPLRVSGL